MDLSSTTYKMLFNNKEELMKLVNKIAENINESINTSMDKLVNDSSIPKQRKLSRRKKFLTYSKSYFTRSKSRKSSYLSRVTKSRNMKKKIYLTKYGLNLIKRSIKGFVTDILI